MPTFQVTDPQTGRKLRLTGDSPPTEAELNEIFKAQPARPTPFAEPVPTLPEPEAAGFPGAGILEPLATVVTGAVAEPLAGLAGLLGLAGTGEPERAAELIGRTREALTFQPRTEAGRRSLQAIGEVIEPVGEVLQKAETFLGDETFEATGSPALAAIATTAPTAAFELLGLKGSQKLFKVGSKTRRLMESRAVKKAIVHAAPEIDDIKNTSRAVFRELDDSGVRVLPSSFEKLNKDIRQNLKGFRERTAPQTARVLDEFQADVGKALSLEDLDELRTVASGLARSTDLNEARLGTIIVNTMDDFLDDVRPDQLIQGNLKATDIGNRYRTARELWGRAKRSEMLNDAFVKAAESGNFEKGIVQQFKSLLKDTKKRRKFFTPDEIDAMQQVTRKSSAINIARTLGQFGFTEGGIKSLLGAGLAGQVGGLPGYVGVPIIGEISKKLANRMTRKGAKFADAITRAGNNADDITKAYLRHTPKAARTAEELSDLLLRPDISLGELVLSENALFKEAAQIAQGRRILNLLITGGVAEISAVKEQGGLDNILREVEQRFPEGTIEERKTPRLTDRLRSTGRVFP